MPIEVGLALFETTLILVDDKKPQFVSAPALDLWALKDGVQVSYGMNRAGRAHCYTPLKPLDRVRVRLIIEIMLLRALPQNSIDIGYGANAISASKVISG